MGHNFPHLTRTFALGVCEKSQTKGALMAALLDWLNGVIWSPALVFLCLAAGVYFTIVTKFIQIRGIPDMLKQLVRGERSENGVSSFESLMMSLAGRVGVGNIAGVATAIAFGGPGAVFGCGPWHCWAPQRHLSNVLLLKSIKSRTRIPVSTAVVRLTTLKRRTPTPRLLHSC